VLRHRRLVVAFWLLLLVAGAAGAGSVSKRLSVDFALPGQEGYETAQQIERIYGNGGEQAPSILVVTVPRGQTVRGDRTTIAAGVQHLRRAQPELRIVDYASTNDPRFVTRDGRTTWAFVFTPRARSLGAPKPSGAAVRLLARTLPRSYSVAATGLQELSQGSSAKGPGIFAETVLGALGALAVLAFVFASLLAFLPLLIAAFAILTTFLIVLGLSYLADISAIVEFLVALVGLGVAIDYSLLIVTRWREERARGLANADAVVEATATAGRAVLLSGVTVGIGLLALVVLPEPAMRSVGFGRMLIPLVSVGVSLTLLPALLGGIGPRFDWPRVRRENHASRAWTAWAAYVVRHKWIAAGAAVLALLVLPFFELTTGETGAGALANEGPARAAYDRLLAGGVPAGVLTPLEVLTRSARAHDVRARLAGVPGIDDAVISTAPDSNRAATTVVLGIPQSQTASSSTLAPVRAAESKLAEVPGVVGVAGEGAISVAYQRAIFGSFPLMLAVIAGLTFVLLARAFRSIVLAIKAIVLNLISLAATFGVMTWFWQQGHGSQLVFGIPATGAITFWLPLMVFAFLFGLSMDYEVFILTRIREEYERTGSTAAAVVEGAGEDRAARDERGADPVPRVRLAGLGAGHRHQGVRNRARRRHPARRDADPGPAAAGARHATRPVQLVDATTAGAAPAGRAVAHPAGRARRGGRRPLSERRRPGRAASRPAASGARTECRSWLGRTVPPSAPLRPGGGRESTAA
jgi:RND superfamily putative drug exporter